MDKNDSVKFIRLTTGEDSISEVDEVREGDNWHYTLYSPLKIVYSIGSRPNVLSVAMMQWVFPKVVSDQIFNIYSNEILTIANPNEKFVEYYWECVQHFNEVREKQNENIELTRGHSISQYEKIEEDTYGIEQLREILDALNPSSNNKGKLH